MRKVILGAGITLDGYIARPDGSVDYLGTPENSPKDLGADMAAFFNTIDTLVFGRKTLEAPLPEGSELPKGPWTTYVFSRTKPPGERDGVVFVNDSPAEFLSKLRQRPGKNIFHMGGGGLARSFLEADLVDELSLGVTPILLGEGIPLFPGGFPQRDFKLIENKTYSTGIIALRYERVRQSG